MIIPGWLLAIYEGEYFVLTIGFVVFTVSYAVLTRGDWRRTVGGRFLMALGSSCSVILLLSILRLLVPQQAWRIYAGAVALGGLVGVVVWLNGLLFVRQLGRHSRTRNDQDDREDQRL